MPPFIKVVFVGAASCPERTEGVRRLPFPAGASPFIYEGAGLASTEPEPKTPCHPEQREGSQLPRLVSTPPRSLPSKSKNGKLILHF